jgi:hypothetical protein
MSYEIESFGDYRCIDCMAAHYDSPLTGCLVLVKIAHGLIPWFSTYRF